MWTTRTEPNERSGFHRTTIELACWRGHRWEAPGYSEWSGTWLNDDNDAQCPECVAWDGEEGPTQPDEE